MKKLFIFIMGLIVTISSHAADYQEGKQYLVLDKPATEKPQAIEFFSFYCGACYQFDQTYHISQKINQSLTEKKVEYHKYHVSFLGGDFGMILTQAWGIAILKHVEEQVKPLIFNGLQKEHSINTLNDIRNIFVQVGVSAEEFDRLWNSFIIKSLLTKQLSAAQYFNVQAVPALYINGRYLIKQDGIASINEFIDVANYLATKK